VLISSDLKCFECNGIGLHDKCMVNPSVFAKQVTCQPNEACYVERFAMDDNSIATTPKDQWVSRGCTQSDVVDVTKYNKTKYLSFNIIFSEYFIFPLLDRMIPSL